MKLDEDCTLNYIITHEAWYWMPDRQHRRCVRVGSDDVVGGGCAWEFMIEEHVFSPSQSALRVGLFDDAWQAFDQVPELFAALAADRPQTFDALRIVLDRIGAHDATEREQPARQ